MEAGDRNWSARRVIAAYSDPEWEKMFPAILTAPQAAQLLQVPLQTLYAWSSRGRLEGCSKKAGKHLRIFRDCLIAKLSNGELA